MNDFTPPPMYVERNGTVKISGSTQPRGAGKCAYHYLRKNYPVEFFCIGATANQQAMKAMGIFIQLVEQDVDYRGKTIAFQPVRCKTVTTDSSTMLQKEKDAVFWRALLVSKI